MAEIPCPLASAALNFPDQPALIDTDRELTYAQFDRLVAQTATRLRAAGVSEGDRVAIVDNNRIEYPIILYALFRLKAVACLLSPRFPPNVLAAQARMATCRQQVVMPGSTIEHTLPNLARIDLAVLGTADTDRTTEPLALDTIQPATILFTSGSAGQPKAVLHSLGNHYYNALGSNKNIRVQPGDRWLLSLPVYHVGGLGIIMRCVLGAGTVVIAAAGGDLPDAITSTGISHISLVPTQLRRLLDNPLAVARSLTGLKAVLVGGGPQPPELIEDARQLGLPVYRSYGLTEMASQVATSRSPDSDQMIVLQYARLRLSENGEIMVSGHSLFKGYVDGPRITRQLDNLGWFATGDIGAIDENGCLQVIGRRDNMFISGGENIQPEQIEAVLCRHPQIEEAVVVPVEDAEFGHRPVAYIRNLKMSDQELVKFLEQWLPRFMIPDAFYSWPREDREPGMKPDRVWFKNLASRIDRTHN